MITFKEELPLWILLSDLDHHSKHRVFWTSDPESPPHKWMSSCSWAGYKLSLRVHAYVWHGCESLNKLLSRTHTRHRSLASWQVDRSCVELRPWCDQSCDHQIWLSQLLSSDNLSGGTFSSCTHALTWHATEGLCHSALCNRTKCTLGLSWCAQHWCGSGFCHLTFPP